MLQDRPDVDISESDMLGEAEDNHLEVMITEVPIDVVPQQTSPRVVPQQASPRVVPQQASPRVVPQQASPRVVPQQAPPSENDEDDEYAHLDASFNFNDLPVDDTPEIREK
jgi:hypothetical protein